MTDKTFGEGDARSSLKRYHRRGPASQTMEILKAVRSRGLKDATLLDIGGGIGAIHHELLDDTVRSATHVDASRAYLKAAEGEASRRGHTGRVAFIHADFIDVASTLPQTDIVTLDRVVCCYPDFRAMLAAAAGHSKRLLALSYPREVWYAWAAIWLIDSAQSLRHDPFRVFVHPVVQMDSVLAAGGMRRMSIRRFAFWEVALYARVTID